jgi:hypothetical protein
MTLQSLQTPWVNPVSLVAVAGTRKTFGGWFLGGCPGPGPPCGVPSPSDKMNSTGEAYRRQIGRCTPPAYRF